MTIYANRFGGRNAVITGGASGLGLEVAKRIVAEGGQVALWDFNNDALESAVKNIKPALVCNIDVSDYSQVKQAAAQTQSALKKIDILIASAGVTGATD